MSEYSRPLDVSALQRIQAALKSWNARPFSTELLDALKRNVAKGSRKHALLTMLRQEDAPILLEAIERQDAVENARRAFRWLWRSGLFAEARRALQSSPELRKEVGLERDLVPDRSSLPLLGTKPTSSEPPEAQTGGIDRATGPSEAPAVGSQDLGPPVYDDVEIAFFFQAEAVARWGLWGESEAARDLRWEVERVARGTREPEPLKSLNVCLSGPSGVGKHNVAKAIHGLGGRASFSTLGPEDGEADSALAVAMAGGTLYLRGCDILQTSVEASVYRAITSRTWQGVPLDTLLIVDVPLTTVVGCGSGGQVNGGRGFPATLGRNVPGNWSFMDVPVLRKRISDVPVLVNKMLERLQADALAEVRQHLAVWFQEEIAKSRAKFDEGRLARAVMQVCEATCPGWSPPAHRTSATPRPGVTEGQEQEATRDGAHAAAATSWEEVTIAITSNDTASVTVGGKLIKRGRFDVLGFGDRRKEQGAVISWTLLKVLAVHDGSIPVSVASQLHLKKIPNLRKAVQDLRKRLKCLLHRKDDPLHRYSRKNRCWCSRFTVRDKSLGGHGGGLFHPPVYSGDEAADEDEVDPNIREIYEEDVKRFSVPLKITPRNFAEGIARGDGDVMFM